MRAARDVPTRPDSAAELLDVVDCDDRIVGTASRAEIHRRRLRHRAVHVLVTNPHGQIYVQQRAAHKDCQPGMWDTSAAGHVDHGESYAAAAQRELAEELGLTGRRLDFLLALPATAASGFEFVRAYHCRCVTEPCPDPTEIAQAGWWSAPALTTWIATESAVFTATFRHIYAHYSAALQP